MNLSRHSQELLEPWTCLTRSMTGGGSSIAALTGGFVARGVKNESEH